MRRFLLILLLFVLPLQWSPPSVAAAAGCCAGCACADEGGAGPADAADPAPPAFERAPADAGCCGVDCSGCSDCAGQGTVGIDLALRRYDFPASHARPAAVFRRPDDPVPARMQRPPRAAASSFA